MNATTTPRRVLITGGASGIGLAVATAFLDEGARVGIISRTRQTIDHALQGALAGYTDRVHTVVADVAQEATIRAGIEELATALGGIDIVVAAAGVEGEMGASVSEVTTEGFRDVLEVNVLGVFHTVKYALPFLTEAEDASVTIIGSDSGFVAASGMLAYNAAKGALVQLTRALSLELFEDHGIRVNSVCPSIVDTPLARRGLDVENFDDAPYPVQTAADVAHSVLFLASKRSKAVNGVNLLSDFGYSSRSSFPA